MTRPPRVWARTSWISRAMRARSSRTCARMCSCSARCVWVAVSSACSARSRYWLRHSPASRPPTTAAQAPSSEKPGEVTTSGCPAPRVTRPQATTTAPSSTANELPAITPIISGSATAAVLGLTRTARQAPTIPTTRTGTRIFAPTRSAGSQAIQARAARTLPASRTRCLPLKPGMGWPSRTSASSRPPRQARASHLHLRQSDQRASVPVFTSFCLRRVGPIVPSATRPGAQR